MRFVLAIAFASSTATAHAEGSVITQYNTYDPTAIMVRFPGAYSTTKLADRTAIAIGSEVSSGDRECHIADGSAIATTTGVAAVVCGGTRGQPRTEVAVVVAPVDVVAELRPIQVGIPTQVHLTVASVATVGADLRIVLPDAQLTVTGLVRTPRGLDLTLTAPTVGPYTLAVSTPGGVELGRVDAEAVAVSNPHTVTKTLGEGVDWRALDLGMLLGFFAPPSLDGAANATIGHPSMVGDTVSWGPEFGARVGWFPTRRVGIELEGALATTGYVSQPGVSAILVSRAQLAVRAVEDGAYGLRILAGADLLTELVDHGTSHRAATGGVHYGAAFTVLATRQTSLRFEVLHVILPSGTAGYASCFEAQLGVVTRFGRRDSWW